MRAVLMSALLAAAGATQAQQVAPPSFLEGMPGARYEGQVSGMDVYVAGGELWLVAPDGRSVITGKLCSSSGRDLGAVFTGAAPADCFGQAQHNGDPLLRGEELERMEGDVARLEAEFFDGGAAVGPEALVALSEKDRDELEASLREILASASSEEEIRAGVKAWTAEAARRIEAAEAEPAEVEAAEAEATEDPVERLLAETRTDALWFGVGRHEAPAVYAYIDPACPYCAKSVVALSEALVAGDLQLRVVLAPLISKRSPSLIAGIFSAEAPPLAFMEHEFAWTEGRTPLPAAELGDLPPAVIAGLGGNVDLVREHGIPGVPFFVFETEEGARFVNGVAGPEDFAGALPDSYLGDS